MLRHNRSIVVIRLLLLELTQWRTGRKVAWTNVTDRTSSTYYVLEPLLQIHFTGPSFIPQYATTITLDNALVYALLTYGLDVLLQDYSKSIYYTVVIVINSH